MKKFILLSGIAIIASFSVSRAQQLHMFSQYMQNDFVLNPATAGNDPLISPLRLVVRNQWTGIQGSPRTQTLSGHCAIAEGKMGLGAFLFNDKFGAVTRTGINATYAYRVDLGKDSKLSFGVSALFYRYHFSVDSLLWDADGNTDPAIYAGSGDFKSFAPNATFGIHYSNPKFWLGLGAPGLIPMKITSTDSFYVVKEKTHLYFNAGYKLKMTDDVFMEPSFLIKQVTGAPVQLDFNVNMRIKNLVNIGASFRTGDAISIMFNTKVKEKYVIGYAYDHIISTLNAYTKGNHEIVLGYNFSCGEKQEEGGEGPKEEVKPTDTPPEPPKETPEPPKETPEPPKPEEPKE